MPKSTKSSGSGKVSKPNPDFPLWPHPSGRWCKKIRGRAHYFGKIADDPKGEAAMERWLEDKDDLLAGRTPRQKKEGVTVAHACNVFLTFKTHSRDAGELTQRSYDRYFETCDRLVKHFGKHRLVTDLTAGDFEKYRAVLAVGRGPVWLANEIQRIRSTFRYCYEAAVIDKPVRFGPGFRKPSAKVLRTNRQKNGPKMFTQKEATAALANATVNGKAMLLLAFNCGLGNTDLGELPIRAVDLEKGILDFPRSKTATERIVPLWRDTSEAIEEVLKHRADPRDEADARLLFIRPRKRDNYVGDRNGVRVHSEIRRILEKAEVKGRTAYDCRRTFQTVAEGARDLPAVQAIMGHAAGQGDMSAVYRQGVDMERKRAVTDHVRDWLFPPEKSGKKA